MKKEKIKKCKHKNILEFEPCYNCGFQTGWCEDCDREVNKKYWEEKKWQES